VKRHLSLALVILAGCAHSPIYTPPPRVETYIVIEPIKASSCGQVFAAGSIVDTYYKPWEWLYHAKDGAIVAISRCKTCPNPIRILATCRGCEELADRCNVASGELKRKVEER